MISDEFIRTLAWVRTSDLASARLLHVLLEAQHPDLRAAPLSCSFDGKKWTEFMRLLATSPGDSEEEWEE